MTVSLANFWSLVIWHQGLIDLPFFDEDSDRETPASSWHQSVALVWGFLFRFVPLFELLPLYIPDSRFPIPDSRFPTPYSRFPPHSQPNQ
ncbi:hypothetical protein [Moorena producens]|uniref:hypothetical protein n=1 Tax=Moorena producens TaxID=1155739 RepID=UPI0011EA635A|nr:hypothetical protein [Moorena producens]